MRRTARVIAMVTVLGIIAAACSGNAAEAPSNTASASGGEIPRGGTIKLAVSSEPDTAAFDPAKEYFQLSWEILKCCVLRMLYTTNGKPVTEGGTELMPDLAAEAPAVSDDELTWTFSIKTGVHFAPPFDDVEITAQDFIRALEREADPDASVGGYSFYYSVIVGFDDFGAGTAKSISGVKAIDDHTLQIKTSEPAGDLGWRMAMPAMAPIPPNANARLGAAEGHTKDYGRFLVGSGPYMFEGADNVDYSAAPEDQKPVSGYIPGRSIVLVRNPAWDPATDDLRPAYADGFEITIGGSVADLFNKVEAGELDYVMDVPEAETLQKYSTDPELQDRLHVYSNPNVTYTSMNLAVPPFDDVHVRKAMNLIFNKAGNRQLAGGPLVGDNAGHIFPNALTNNVLETYDPYETDGANGDLALAMEEMKQSKYDTNDDGVCDADECKNILAFYESDTATGQKVAALWQSVLEPLGISLNVKGLAFTPLGAKCNDLPSQVPICLELAWGQDYPDAYVFGPPLFGGSDYGALYPGCCNSSAVGATPEELQKWGYGVTSVPSVDDKLAECTAIPTGDDRINCWVELDKMLMEDVVPWVPRTFSNTTDIVSARVVNYSFDEFAGINAFDHMAVSGG